MRSWSHRGRGRPATDCGSCGFTLIELLLVLTLIGILVAIATAPIASYLAAGDESATSARVLDVLRSTAEQASAQARTYCVSFDTATTWSVWRYSCDPAYTASELGVPAAPVKVATGRARGAAVLSQVTLAAWAGNPGDASPCPAPAAGCAYFSARGTASPGTITVSRPGSTSQYRVTVVALTGQSYVTH